MFIYLHNLSLFEEGIVENELLGFNLKLLFFPFPNNFTMRLFKKFLMLFSSFLRVVSTSVLPSSTARVYDSVTSTRKSRAVA